MQTTRLFVRPASFLAFLVSLSLPGVHAMAQTSTGAISVSVADPSGSPVTGADITVTGTETGAVLRQLKTNGSGIAAVPLVPPGRYNVDISMGRIHQRSQAGARYSGGCHRFARYRPAGRAVQPIGHGHRRNAFCRR